MEDVLKAGLIREDLYYLIDILPIHVPPLRDRIEDVPYLMEHFAQKVSNELNLPYQGFSERSTSVFLDYAWPGNIRELQSYVTSAVINAEGRLIEPEDVTSSLILKEIFDEFNPGKIPDSWEEMEQMKREAAYRASRRIEKLFLEHLINHKLLSSKPPFNK